MLTVKPGSPFCPDLPWKDKKAWCHTHSTELSDNSCRPLIGHLTCHMIFSYHGYRSQCLAYRFSRDSHFSIFSLLSLVSPFTGKSFVSLQDVCPSSWHEIFNFPRFSSLSYWLLIPFLQEDQSLGVHEGLVCPGIQHRPTGNPHTRMNNLTFAFTEKQHDRRQVIQVFFQIPSVIQGLLPPIHFFEWGEQGLKNGKRGGEGVGWWSNLRKRSRLNCVSVRLIYGVWALSLVQHSSEPHHHHKKQPKKPYQLSTMTVAPIEFQFVIE